MKLPENIDPRPCLAIVKRFTGDRGTHIDGYGCAGQWTVETENNELEDSTGIIFVGGDPEVDGSPVYFTTTSIENGKIKAGPTFLLVENSDLSIHGTSMDFVIADLLFDSRKLSDFLNEN